MFRAWLGPLTSAQCQRQYGAALGWIYDAIIPQPGAGVVGVTLPFLLGAHGRADGLRLLLAQRLALGGQLVAAHLHQYAGGLFPPHH